MSYWKIFEILLLFSILIITNTLTNYNLYTYVFVLLIASYVRIKLKKNSGEIDRKQLNLLSNIFSFSILLVISVFSSFSDKNISCSLNFNEIWVVCFLLNFYRLQKLNKIDEEKHKSFNMKYMLIPSIFLFNTLLFFQTHFQFAHVFSTNLILIILTIGKK